MLVALVAGSLAGLAGWLYSLQTRIVGQDVLGLDVALNGLMYALVGGVQQPILGSVLGTSIVRTLGAAMPQAAPPSSLVAGIGLLLVVYLLPNGILGLLSIAKLPAARRSASCLGPEALERAAAPPNRCAAQ